jgi:4-hydroxy-tetrahydrodipicolinate synthase
MSSSAVSSIAKGGVFTALVTPFSADGSTVDYAALEKIVEFQIADGIAGLVPVPTYDNHHHPHSSS